MTVAEVIHLGKLTSGTTKPFSNAISELEKKNQSSGKRISLYHVVDRTLLFPTLGGNEKYRFANSGGSENKIKMTTEKANPREMVLSSK